MTQRLPVPPAPGPLEAYCQQFDPLFDHRPQRDAFRRYLEGLLLPTERNKGVVVDRGLPPGFRTRRAAPHPRVSKEPMDPSGGDAPRTMVGARCSAVP